MLAALGADSPELSSAVIAITAGAGTVGIGVVVGSNLFNLAALLGLPAVLAGGVLIRRQPLLLDAAVGMAAIVITATLLGGLLSPLAAALVVLPIGAAYLFILAAPRNMLRRFNGLLRAAPQNPLELAYDIAHDIGAAQQRSWTPVLLLPVALSGVVGGSFVMVHQALAAQKWLHLSDAVLGSIVLAALTSLPNLWVAMHFARTNRGTALFSSAMNSNTINLLGGLIVPAMFFGTAAARGSLPYFTWLIGLTLLAVLAPLYRSRLSRIAGVAIIAVYLMFAALTLAAR